MEATQVALLVSIDGILEDPCEVPVMPAQLDGEVARPLFGRDEGASFLAVHARLFGTSSPVPGHLRRKKTSRQAGPEVP